MAVARKVQLFNLFEFVESFWEPAKGKVKESEGPGGRTQDATAQWIETLFWLHLGRELDFYPALEANSVFLRERAILLQLFQQHESALEKLIPPRLFVVLRGVLNTGAEPVSLDEFVAGEDLLPYFQSGLGLAGETNGDELITHFRHFITMNSDRAVEERLNKPMSPKVVTDLFTDETEANVESVERITAGFLRMVEKMLCWSSWFAALRMDSELDAGARASLQRRIGQITCWHLNLHDASIKKRFLVAARHASELMAAVASEAKLVMPQLPAWHGQSFIEAIEQLADDWLRDHPYRLYLTASK